MVVCKCRKATKLYCFVHKVPVCGECICFQEHRICVVRTYSEWVIDGEYDWPTKCCSCHVNFDEGADDTSIVRLGCLHIIHSKCFVSHLQSYPPHTAPAGYVCPSCSTPIWPPKSVKDSGSRFHYKLKEAVSLTGLEKNVFGNHLPAIESRLPPPAFSSEPLVRLTPENHSKLAPVETLNSSNSSAPKEGFSAGKSEIVEVDGSVSIGSQYPPDLEPNYVNTLSPVGPGATTRKGGHHVDRQNSEQSYYADDEDGHHHKYSRRGPLRHKFLRSLLPFWSSNLPVLPVTAPPRNDIGVAADDTSDGRGKRKRSSRTDPRKLLLIVALMACMATMAVLYYRLAQRSLAESQREDHLQ